MAARSEEDRSEAISGLTTLGYLIDGEGRQCDIVFRAIKALEDGIQGPELAADWASHCMREVRIRDSSAIRRLLSASSDLLLGTFGQASRDERRSLIHLPPSRIGTALHKTLESLGAWDSLPAGKLSTAMPERVLGFESLPQSLVAAPMPSVCWGPSTQAITWGDSAQAHQIVAILRTLVPGVE